VFQQWPYTQILAPLVGFAVVGIFALLLRWAFGRGRSVVTIEGRPGHEDEYGLLTPVGRPLSFIEGEIQRRRLAEQGIRATIANTLDGPRVLVLPRDAARAEQVLRN
jgi:hypothetical protein